MADAPQRGVDLKRKDLDLSGRGVSIGSRTPRGVATDPIVVINCDGYSIQR